MKYDEPWDDRRCCHHVLNPPDRIDKGKDAGYSKNERWCGVSVAWRSSVMRSSSFSFK